MATGSFELLIDLPRRRRDLDVHSDNDFSTHLFILGKILVRILINPELSAPLSMLLHRKPTPTISAPNMVFQAALILPAGQTR